MASLIPIDRAEYMRAGGAKGARIPPAFAANVAACGGGGWWGGVAGDWWVKVGRWRVVKWR